MPLAPAPAPNPTYNPSLTADSGAAPSGIAIDAAGNQVVTNGAQKNPLAFLYRQAQFMGLPLFLGAMMAAGKAKPSTPWMIAGGSTALQYYLKGKIYPKQAILSAAGLIGGYHLILAPSKRRGR
jgi:hypothetical protein